MLSQSDRRNRGAHKFSQIKLFFFKFSFFTNTISVWNRLPQSIALSPNIESFKNGICTLTFEGFPTHLYDTYCKPLYIIHVIFVCLFFVLFIIVFNCPCTYRTQFRDVTHSILIVQSCIWKKKNVLVNLLIIIWFGSSSSNWLVFTNLTTFSDWTEEIQPPFHFPPF